ncbi:hypothetical protein RZS08_45490, partial [Arthrospira platensis SPKY1]|nr:hypothetical protein [Arthrospira platensis SPKY1]
REIFNEIVSRFQKEVLSFGKPKLQKTVITGKSRYFESFWSKISKMSDSEKQAFTDIIKETFKFEASIHEAAGHIEIANALRTMPHEQAAKVLEIVGAEIPVDFYCIGEWKDDY